MILAIFLRSNKLEMSGLGEEMNFCSRNGNEREAHGQREKE
jgi:hypothetical protein